MTKKEEHDAVKYSNISKTQAKEVILRNHQTKPSLMSITNSTHRDILIKNILKQYDTFLTENKSLSIKDAGRKQMVKLNRLYSTFDISDGSGIADKIIYLPRLRRKPRDEINKLLSDQMKPVEQTVLINGEKFFTHVNVAYNIGYGSYGQVYLLNNIYIIDNDLHRAIPYPPCALKVISGKSRDVINETKALQKLFVATHDKNLPHLPLFIDHSSKPSDSNSFFITTHLAIGDVRAYLRKREPNKKCLASIIMQVLFSIHFLHLALPNDRFCDAHLGNFLMYKCHVDPNKESYWEYTYKCGTETKTFKIKNCGYYITSWDFGLINECNQIDYPGYDYFRAFSSFAGFDQIGLINKKKYPVIKQSVHDIAYDAYKLSDGTLTKEKYEEKGPITQDWKLPFHRYDTRDSKEKQKQSKQTKQKALGTLLKLDSVHNIAKLCEPSSSKAIKIESYKLTCS